MTMFEQVQEWTKGYAYGEHVLSEIVAMLEHDVDVLSVRISILKDQIERQFLAAKEAARF
jgi:uncharacterized small protein (DUF1192 family)